MMPYQGSQLRVMPDGVREQMDKEHATVFQNPVPRLRCSNF
jgi:hypothetical protein